MNEVELKLLHEIVATSESGGIAYVSASDVTGLVKLGYVETNPQMQNAGKIAARATGAGLAAIQNQEAAASPAPALPPVPPAAPVVPPAPPIPPAPLAPGIPPIPERYSTGTGFQRPEKGRKKREKVGRKRYPFEDLPMGGYIFIPATPERPKLSKGTASTVASANARFEKHEPRLFFRYMSVKEGQVCGEFVAPSAGVVIYRDTPPADEPKATETAGA